MEPTPGQCIALAKAFGCARLVYNDAVALRRVMHAAGEPFLTESQLQTRVITQAKKTSEREFLSEVSSVVLVQAVSDANSAYRAFFASTAGRRKGPKVGPPRFRSRKDTRQSIRLTRNGFSLRNNGRLYLAKIGEVTVRWSRKLPSPPSSVTVIRDSAGRFFASFVVETDPAADDDRFPDTESETGIDLGLTSFAVLSDGTAIDNPKLLRRAERKLKKAQQSVSRKQKGSKNRAKSVKRLAKAHAKVADARRDHHHKLSTKIIAENQGVYVENLAVAGLGRTRLAKAVHDAGWSSFVDMLDYKAARYGRSFAKADRFAPTSQICSSCGLNDGPKPLAVRIWTCKGCGAVHERDLNAARNILKFGKLQVAAGQAETRNACGARVRPGATPARRREAGTLPKRPAEPG